MTNGHPHLILDTCALRDKDFLRWLGKYNGNKSIPSVVYMEQLRQFLNNGVVRPMDQYQGDNVEINAFDELLNASKIKVLPFEKKHAVFAANVMNVQPRVCKSCNKFNWVDVMVSAYIGNGQFVVTNNIDDFPVYAGYEDRILTPEEVKKRFS